MHGQEASCAQKCTYYSLQMPLCSNTCKLLCSLSFESVKQVASFFLAPVCGGGFTLTFHIHIDSDCVGAQSLLSKDIGEGAVILLPATRLLLPLTSQKA